MTDNSKIAMSWKAWIRRNVILFFCYMFAMSVRGWLLSERNLDLTDRVELSTPLNSYKRLTEGIALLRQNVDPYSGVLFHETPIILHAFNLIKQYLPESSIHLLFILTDVLTAFVLGKLGALVATSLLQEQSKEKIKYHEDAKDLLLDPSDISLMENYVQFGYLFHPYIVANCVAKTTTVFSNFVLSLFLLAMLKKWTFIATFCLALATHQTLYPVMLLFPLCCVLLRDTSMNAKDVTMRIVIPTTMKFIFSYSALHIISYTLMGFSNNFVASTHGFILAVPELTPNMGLFWYFFTEMFEHFRIFFLCTFQLNCFVYVIPLSIRFWKSPYLLTFTLIGLISIFKSYPCYGEVGFYTSLLPTIALHLLPFMKQTFIVANMFLASTMLGPILYQLWIYNGSANANYFFAITLVFGTAQIFLITDILFAYVKREFYLVNGYKAIKTSNNGTDEMKLVLK